MPTKKTTTPVPTAQDDAALDAAYAQVTEASDDTSDDTSDASATDLAAAIDETLTAAHAKAALASSDLSIQIPRTQLQKALAAVKPAVATKTTLPILSHVLLRRLADPSTLQVIATNLEIGLIYEMPLLGMLPESGASTLPAGLFTELVSSLPADELVKLRVDALTHQAKIETRRSRATLRSMDPTEFPTLPLERFVAQEPLRVNAKALRLLIESVVSAAAKDAARPVFTGVELSFQEQTITAAAADSFRLYKMAINTTVPEAFVGRTVLAPARSLATLVSVLPAEAEVEITLSADANQSILFRATHEGDIIAMVANLISGQFPNWHVIVPSRDRQDTSVRVNRKNALNALKAVSLFARDNSNILRVMVDAAAGTLTFSATAEDVGDTSQVIDGVEVTGANTGAIMNIVYLRDMLTVLTGETAELRIMPSDKSEYTGSPIAVYTPDGAPEQVEHLMCVVMPMANTK